VMAGTAQVADRLDELQPGRPLLALREILLQAVLRAELLLCRPVAGKTERTFANFTTWLGYCRHIPSHLAHGRASSARDTRRLFGLCDGSNSLATVFGTG